MSRTLGRGRSHSSPADTRLPSPDLSRPTLHFVELARSFGVPAVRVSTEKEIGPALDLALASSGPFLIDWVLPHAPVDPGADRRCGQ